MADQSAIEPIESLQCPGCNTTLYKVSVAPGAKVRCLHCGAKFHPVMPGAAEGAGAAAAPAPGREPHSPGYFLLRIPAVVLCFAGFFFTAWVCYSVIYELRRGRTVVNSLESLVPYTYLPLATIVGLLAIVWTRSLARIDARMMHLLWQQGIIREPLPPPPGSSLPYIAPLALAGGIIPIWLYKLNPDEAEDLIFPALIGAVVFYFGFAAEDLRQFAWRQLQLAKKLCSPEWQGSESVPFGTVPFGAIAFSAGFGSFALMSMYVYWDTPWMPDRQFLAVLTPILAGMAVTSFFVLNSWEQAVEWQRRALIRRGNRQSAAAYPRWLACVPLVWAGYFVLWLAGAIINDPPNRHEEWPIVLASVGALACAAGLARILWGIADWAAATSQVRKTLSTAEPAGPEWLSTQLIRVIILCVVVECLLFTPFIFFDFTRYRWDWVQVLAVPIFVGALHYPTLWLGAVAGEFIRVERGWGVRSSLDD